MLSATLALFVGLAVAAPLNKRAVGQIPTATNVLTLRKSADPTYPTAFDQLAKHRLAPAPNDTIAELDGVSYNRAYATDLTIGGQTFEVIVDTGSSDTWVIERGFVCVDGSGNVVPESECDFGSDGYDPALSTTFETNPNGYTFNVSYASGEILLGNIASESVEVGGINVTNQNFGLVDRANWFGDNSTSGLLGLAYPYLTSSFDDMDADGDGRNDTVEYDPWFFSAVKQNLTLPYFSIALDRPASNGLVNTDNLGYLALGGALPLETMGENVTVPIQQYRRRSAGSSSPTSYIYYTIPIDKYNLGSADNSAAILDTGTTLSYLPNSVVSDFYTQIVPEPIATRSGSYYTFCDASLPEISATIGNREFPFNSTDLLLNSGITLSNGTEYCLLGIQPGGSEVSGDVFILGDSWMRSHVATFNLQDNVITLAERAPY